MIFPGRASPLSNRPGLLVCIISRGGKANAASLREIIDQVGELINLEPIIQHSDSLPHPVPVTYVSDLTRIREQLGWKPEIGIEEGLRSLL